MTALAARLSVGRQERIDARRSRAQRHVRAADGFELGVLDEGHGEPIVLVTGAMMAASDWDRVAPHLRQFRFVRYTRRLYASSQTTRQMALTHSLARELDDLRAVLDAVGEPVTLVGHSSGAVVALELTRRDPERVRRLVLYEPPLPIDAPIGGAAAERMRALVAAGKDGPALALFMREMVRVPLWMRALVRVVFPLAGLTHFAAAQLADVDAIDAEAQPLAEYAALALPTLLLRGVSSPAHLRERVARLASVMLDARIVELPTGHNAESLRPGELGRAIADFVAHTTPWVGSSTA
jgi:pimeloyl-ACP methyl ester carboxylesterase